MKAYSQAEWKKIAEASGAIQRTLYHQELNAEDSKVNDIVEAGYLDAEQVPTKISAMELMIELEWESKFMILLRSIDRRTLRM